MPEIYKRHRAEAWGTDLDRYVLEHPVIEIDDILVDVEAFFETRSTCEMCSIPCNWGTSVLKENIEKLAPVLDEIKKKYLPQDRWNSVGWHYSKEQRIHTTNIVEVEKGRKACSFLYKKGDHFLCSIYSWALETGRPVSTIGLLNA